MNDPLKTTFVDDGKSEKLIGMALVVVICVFVAALLLAVLALPAVLTYKLGDLRWLIAYPGLLLAFALWVVACRHG